MVSLALASLLAAASAAQVHELCPRVRFVGPAPELTDAERKLVCGDPGSEGWREIPLHQARYFVTAFLQRRGRYFPDFATLGESLVVHIGTPAYVSKVTGSGLGGIYDLGKRRGIVGSLLTPSLLDKVKDAVVFELQSRGYACPEVEVTADARTGEVRVAAAPGEAHLFRALPRPVLERIDPVILERYQAFREGDPFDIRLLALSSERIRKDGLFISAYFELLCSSAGHSLRPRVVSGEPGLLTLGVGADTEGLVMGRARWRQSRIGYRASTARLTILASKLEQTIDGAMRWFLAPSARLHLVPAGFIRREDEVNYSAAHTQVSLSPAWTRDAGGLRLEVSGGLAGDYFDTLDGLGPSGSKWMAFITRAEVRSELFEYYGSEPRRGWTAYLESSSRLAGAGSRIHAHTARLGGEALWNLGNYEPPLAVLATRGFLAGTKLGRVTDPFAQLPPTDRVFLGGDADLRGIPRKRLPDDGTGFLTAVYDGLELRAGDVLPWRLQPFVFLDAALGSPRELELDPDVYYSPGAGLRWVSPIGTVRGTAGRGLVWRRGSPTPAPKPQWRYFVSLGREF